MKKSLFILFSIILFSCSKDENNNQSYTFQNNTDYEVILSPSDITFEIEEEIPDFELIIPPNETKTYKSEFEYVLFDVFSFDSELFFRCNLSNDKYVITSYEYAVKYLIQSTANSASITYNDANGNTVQKTISLPKEIEFGYFYEDFLYISAQNETDFGSIEVFIYYFGTLLDRGACSSNYCIAEASATI